MNLKSSTVAVLGTGAWGSALGRIVQKNGCNVRFWSHRGAVPLKAVVEDAEIIVSAVAMKGVLPTVDRLQALSLSKRQIVVTATKGLDLDTTLTAGQIWYSAFPRNPVVVLSGPNLAREIEQGLPTATVLASYDLAAAELAQSVFNSDIFRAYINQDPLGTELGGTLKNIIAIAAGACDGMKLGTNAKAALLTRALPEMIRIGTSLGASAETFFGLSGLGDLIATCNSPLSRNYQVGYGLAQGRTLNDILANLSGTVEGINTTNVAIAIANSQAIAVPITRQVYRLLHYKIDPTTAIQALMARELRPEFCDLEL